jgi:hypothetical protein
VPQILEIHSNLLHVLEVVELLPKEGISGPLVITLLRYLEAVCLLLFLVVELLLLRSNVPVQEGALLQLLHVTTHHHVHTFQFGEDIVALAPYAVAYTLTEWAHPIVLNGRLANVVLVTLLQALAAELATANQFAIYAIAVGLLFLAYMLYVLRLRFDTKRRFCGFYRESLSTSFITKRVLY